MRLLTFSGRLRQSELQPGLVGVTFALYKDQDGGSPLWIETQNVEADDQGRFTVVLGVATTGGIPSDMFASGEARWLGMQRIPEREQPRILLASVPYALKASDADTLGGKPLSAFVLADATTSSEHASSSKRPKTTNGTAGYVAKFIDSVNIDNSIMYESAGRIGLYTTSPQAPIHIATAVPYRNLSVGSIQTGTAPGIMLENPGTNSSTGISDSNGLVVFVSSSATAPMSGTDQRLVVRPTGFLGLGVSNPLAPLHVGKVANYRNLNVASVQTGAYPGIMLENTTTNTSVGITENAGLSIYATPSSSLPFSGPDLKMIITGSGDVGIGTTGAPGNRLRVVSNSSTSIFGVSNGSGYHAIRGDAPDGSVAILGIVPGNVSTDIFANAGVLGFNFGSGNGVIGQSNSGAGVNGYSSSGQGVFGGSSTGLAGSFQGNVTVTGTLSKGGGAFKIDHPLDPENKYLLHSFVESPDMMNVYNGNAVLDGAGEVWITLPNWFQALNRDFRYQLTAIGAAAPNLHIASEVADNRFMIAGGTPGGKVSWQVTGIRQDRWANANRIQVEQEKRPEERGYYLHPELFGQPREKAVPWSRGEIVHAEPAAAIDSSRQ